MTEGFIGSIRVDYCRLALKCWQDPSYRDFGSSSPESVANLLGLCFTWDTSPQGRRHWESRRYNSALITEEDMKFIALAMRERMFHYRLDTGYFCSGYINFLVE
jgi:hypothetical protein